MAFVVGAGGFGLASSAAFTSEGVITRTGARVASCSRIATMIIFWMVPRRAGDSSPEEVSEEVLRHRGSTIGSSGLGGAGIGVPRVGAREVPETTCRTWVLPGTSTNYCLLGGLTGFPLSLTSLAL
ncbi:UNVERIFIED_CONTAM: hypothetical protein Sangu_2914200 [Sesamum angustifolium]|uniref:Secreted protein n=1 Tax=Sesamum angustifolium TaxID=2727405 RepID=A0AAW2IL56_9LAMI